MNSAALMNDKQADICLNWSGRACLLLLASSALTVLNSHNYTWKLCLKFTQCQSACWLLIPEARMLKASPMYNISAQVAQSFSSPLFYPE